MVECSYCGQEVGDEDAHLAHLDDEHYADLGRIDRRRVDERFHASGRDWSRVGLLTAGLLAFLAIYALLFVGPFGDGNGGAPIQRGEFGSTHVHGSITVQLDDRTPDFSRERWQLRADCFHFEANEGNRWHAHCTGTTLQYGMGTLGIDVTAEGVTVEGETYREGEGATVSVTVNDQPVDPATYVLRDGDRVVIVARRT